MTAMLFGLLAALLALIPGVHLGLITTLFVTFFPAGPDFGLLIATAVGASCILSSLSRTYHPTAPSQLANAAPEVRLAYRGYGPEVVQMQSRAALYAGLMATITATILTAFLYAIDPKSAQELLSGLTKLLTVPALSLFLLGTIAKAKRKLATVGVITATTLLGLYSGHTLAGNPHAMTALLGGIYTAASCLLSLSDKAGIQPFPEQRETGRALNFGHTFIGYLAGCTTSVTAGLGPTAITSTAGAAKDPNAYITVQTAADTTNQLMALCLLLLAGSSRSAEAASIQLAGGVSLGMLPATLFGLLLAYQAVPKLQTHYVALATKLAHPLLPTTLLLGAVALTLWLVGLPGLPVFLAGAAIGCVSRAAATPNQAATFCVAGPVLTGNIGLW